MIHSSCVLFHFNGDFKLYAAHDTGGGKQTDILLKETVYRDLSALGGEHNRPQLPGLDQQQAKAVQRAVVEDGTSRCPA